MPPIKHYPFSASASKRWMNCPGSYRACMGIERASTYYAKEGTAAHELCERCLRNGADADAYLGQIISVEGEDFEVTEEMADAVQVYLDTVRDDLSQFPAAELRIEHKFVLESIHPDLGGTSDANATVPFHKVIVYDYKHGRGVSVDAEENTQAMIYAVGAVINEDLEEVEIVIVQPRAGKKGGGVKRWTTTRSELLAWANGPLREATLAAERPDAPRKAGEWCKFCSAAALCPETRKTVMEAASVAFDDAFLPTLVSPTLPAPESLTPEEVSRIVALAEVAEPWFKNVKDFAREGIRSGAFLPGEAGFLWKLVAGRPGNRKYADEEAAKVALTRHLRQDAFVTKILSPAQAEKALLKKVKDGGTYDLKTKEDAQAVIAAIVTRPEGKHSLVPVTDERPAIVFSAMAAFEEDPLPESAGAAAAALVSAEDF